MTTRQAVTRLSAGLCAVAAVSTAVASAATISLYDRQTFWAAVATGALSQQTFDADPELMPFVADGEVTYSASAGVPTVTGGFANSTGPHGLGSSATFPPTYYFLDTETLTLTFAQAITAFGIDINTFATEHGAYSATLDIGDVIPSVPEAFPFQLTGHFLGFISDTPFAAVTISAHTGHTYTVDTLVYGHARAVRRAAGEVPEPAMLALLALGLATSLSRSAHRSRA